MTQKSLEGNPPDQHIIARKLRWMLVGFVKTWDSVCLHKVKVVLALAEKLKT